MPIPTSLKIIRKSQNVWVFKDNTIAGEKFRAKSGYSGDLNQDEYSFMSKSGGNLYNQIPFENIEYIDEVNPENSFVPSSAIQLHTYLMSIGFFADSSGGGGTATTFKELLDVLIPNYFGLDNMVPVVDEDQQRLVFKPYSNVRYLEDLEDVGNVENGQYLRKQPDGTYAGGDGLIIEQDNQDIRIYFGYAIGATQQTMLANINNLPPFEINEKQSVWLIGREAGIRNGTQIYLTGKQTKYKMMNKGKGTYGMGGTQLTNSDLEFIYQTPTALPNIVNDEDTQTIGYGALTNQTVSEWLNTQSPSILIQQQEEGYVLFEGMINGQAISYLFIGAGGSYGVGFPASTEDDFEAISQTAPVLNQDNKIKVVLFNYSDTSTPQQILNNINGLGAYTVDEYQNVIFKGNNLTSQNSRKYALVNKGKGTYGIGGIQLALSDIELIYDSATGLLLNFDSVLGNGNSSNKNAILENATDRVIYSKTGNTYVDVVTGLATSVGYQAPIANTKWDTPAKPAGQYYYASQQDVNTLSITVNQAASELYLRNAAGTTLATVSLGFLNNEGTTFFYNESDQTLQLKNDQGEILSTIPVSSFVSNMIQSASFNNGVPSDLEFRDNENNVLFIVAFAIENIAGLQDALNAANQDLQDTLGNGSTAVVPEDVSIQATGNNGSYSKVDIKKDGTFLWNAQDENGFNSSVGIGNGGYNQYGVGTFFSYFASGYQFITDEGDIIFSGNADFKGLQYDQDYSANFTDRSLVDKAYVDGVSENLPFIPLTGTPPDVFFSGNINTADDGEKHGFSYLSLEGNNAFVGMSESFEATLRYINEDNTFSEIRSSNLGNFVASTLPNARGLTGLQDFTANIQPLDYVQKKYVDGFLPLSGTTSENPITGSLDIESYNNPTPWLSFLDDGASVSKLSGSTSGIVFTFPVSNKVFKFLNSSIPDNGFVNLKIPNANNGTLAVSASLNGSAPVQADANGIVALTFNGPLLLASSAIDSSALTGTTSVGVLSTLLIPANSIGSGTLDIIAKFEKTGAAGAGELRIYRNSTPDLSGTPVQIARVSHAAGTLYGPIYRTFELKDNTLQGFSFTTSAVNDYAASTAVRSSTPFAIASAQYIVIAGVLSNAADSMKQTSLKITFNKNL